MQRPILTKLTSWGARTTISFILIQTLFYKFTAHPESVEIFTKAGMEPWGRIMTGILELTMGILLLIPGTVLLGATGTLIIMAGALFFHITDLGFDSLFLMALLVFSLSLTTVFIHRNDEGGFFALFKRKRKQTSSPPS